jgi:uncharacterized protein (TIGR02679 family)
MSPGASGPAPGSGLERVLALARRRLERNGLRAAGRVRLERITPAEMAALSGLLGPRWRAVPPGAPASIDLAALDAALREAPGGGSLAEAAARAAGAPLVDRSGARSAAADARERSWAELVAHPAVKRHPPLAGWLARERRSGAAARAGGGDPFAILRAALDVLDALPADPPQTLTRFAAGQCGGDPHALDRGRALDGAVCRAVAVLEGDAAPAGGAEARRARYDRWGIGCDELTSTVLCLGLRPAGREPLAVALASAAARGEPRVITLRELRAVESLACGQIVYCCENPAVVAAAADDLGPSCPSLVCTGGWPSTAALRLLRALVAGGAAVQLHGDMDPDGLRILQRMLEVTNGRLWRMAPADHARYAALGERPTTPCTGIDVAHPQLRDLAAAIAEDGALVREELVVDELLADLRHAATAGGVAA